MEYHAIIGFYGSKGPERPRGNVIWSEADADVIATMAIGKIYIDDASQRWRIKEAFKDPATDGDGGTIIAVCEPEETKEQHGRT